MKTLDYSLDARLFLFGYTLWLTTYFLNNGYAERIGGEICLTESGKKYAMEMRAQMRRFLE